ncbi:MAG TPA: hypothetical protein VFC61_06610, partial [Blastocatellia bacterium]|nr:hypothetical protein [Blastocatellia bacterium]
PFLGPITAIQADASSTYHALQLQLNQRLTRGLQFTAAYTWSHAIDEVSDIFDLAGARTLPQDSFDRSAERGDANFDLRHRFVASFIWDLPLWAQSRLLGGWQLAGIGTLQTGQPFTIFAAYDVNLDGNLTDRLNSDTGFREVNEGGRRFEFTAAPALAASGRNGAVGRNTFRGPGVATVDLTVNKSFRFSERQVLEVRAEIFNLFNRAHYGLPVHQTDFPGFGRSVETRVAPRTVQFALKYSF